MFEKGNIHKMRLCIDQLIKYGDSQEPSPVFPVGELIQYSLTQCYSTIIEDGAQLFSHVRIVVAPWTSVCQAPLSMKFSRQEYWSGLPFPTPGNLPDPEIESDSTALVGGFFTTEPCGKPIIKDNYCQKINCSSLTNNS